MHNEALAKELVERGYRYKDLAVTAAFYAAVHYFEARLHDHPPLTHPEATSRIFHTDASIPQTGFGRKYSPHLWRELLLRYNSPPATRHAYRQLRVASEQARYHADIVVSTTSHDYFTSQVVDRFLSNDLETIKRGLGLS